MLEVLIVIFCAITYPQHDYCSLLPSEHLIPCLSPHNTSSVLLLIMSHSSLNPCTDFLSAPRSSRISMSLSSYPFPSLTFCSLLLAWSWSSLHHYPPHCLMSSSTFWWLHPSSLLSLIPGTPSLVTWKMFPFYKFLLKLHFSPWNPCLSTLQQLIAQTYSYTNWWTTNLHKLWLVLNWRGMLTASAPPPKAPHHWWTFL